MSKKIQKPESGRRSFLRNVTLGASVAAVASNVQADMVATADVPSAPTDAASSSKGYEETPHVKRYYELARS